MRKNAFVIFKGRVFYQMSNMISKSYNIIYFQLEIIILFEKGGLGLVKVFTNLFNQLETMENIKVKIRLY